MSEEKETESDAKEGTGDRKCENLLNLSKHLINDTSPTQQGYLNQSPTRYVKFRY